MGGTGLPAAGDGGGQGGHGLGHVRQMRTIEVLGPLSCSAVKRAVNRT